ncbi:hypothetical protein GWI33_002287, partial [Rhynchophorus ferrugineus]
RKKLMPYFVVDTMGHIPGLSGLFVAGIFSASLSTISAALNCLAAVTMEDYYKPLYRYFRKKSPSSKRVAIQTKFLALLYGVICIAMAFIVQHLGSILSASLTIFGVVGGPLLGLFTLGMFTLMANEAGSLTGLTCGIVLGLWMGFGPKPPLTRLPTRTDGCENLAFNSTMILSKSITKQNRDYMWLYRVSYLYNGVFGFLATLIIGYSASFIIRRITGRTIEQENYDHNLFIPCLSKSVLVRKKDNKTFMLVQTSEPCDVINDDNFQEKYTKVDLD